MKYNVWQMMCLMLVSLMLSFQPTSSHAQTLSEEALLLSISNNGGQGDKAGCTSEFPKADNSDGLITQIIDYVKEVTEKATQDLFNGIAYNQSFLDALDAAFILFITIFGVMFIFGIVPLTFGQAATRLFKFAIIITLIKEGYPFLDEYVIKFFNEGTDELIDAVIGIATGDNSPATPGANGKPQPFTKLEGLVSEIISPKMMIEVITAMTTGPMGLPMGGLMGMGMIAFIQTIVKALKVYCLSIVAKALLFGMAPIFLTFMMFERTKHIFSGWTNQLVNYSLQPLFMFAFLSFFIILLHSAAENMLNAEICWSNYKMMGGNPNAMSGWAFQPKGGGKNADNSFTWNGAISCLKGGNAGACEDFPVSIIDILTFLILAHLAYRFSDVVIMIATEISSSTLFLDKVRGGMGNYFKNASGGTQNQAKGAISKILGGS